MTTSPVQSITDELLEDAARDFEGVGSLYMARVSYQELADACRELIRLRAENSDLKQQLVAAGITAENCEMFRRDAGRYRWLRDSSESVHQFYLSTPIWFTGVKFSKENVDNTIDASMQERPQ